MALAFVILSDSYQLDGQNGFDCPHPSNYDCSLFRMATICEILYLTSAVSRMAQVLSAISTQNSVLIILTFVLSKYLVIEILSKFFKMIWQFSSPEAQSIWESTWSHNSVTQRQETEPNDNASAIVAMYHTTTSQRWKISRLRWKFRNSTLS